MFTNRKSRKGVLKAAVRQREDEVLYYQINIDNYRLAIERASSDPDLAEFCKQLGDRLGKEIVEQKKAQIMLDVVRSQV